MTDLHVGYRSFEDAQFINLRDSPKDPTLPQQFFSRPSLSRQPSTTLRSSNPDVTVTPGDTARATLSAGSRPEHARFRCRAGPEVLFSGRAALVAARADCGCGGTDRAKLPAISVRVRVNSARKYVYGKVN